MGLPHHDREPVSSVTIVVFPIVTMGSSFMCRLWPFPLGLWGSIQRACFYVWTVVLQLDCVEYDCVKDDCVKYDCVSLHDVIASLLSIYVCPL